MEKTNNSGRDAPKKAQLNVLLIEDSDTDAHLVERALKKFGQPASFTRANTMKDGVEILIKGKTDVLLLDLGLPDTADPADTYARIKPWAQKLPVVIMTNLKDHDFARTMVQEGVADFLNKDAISKDLNLVENAIDFSVARHAASRQLMSEREKAVKDSKEKDTILSCFMGGYSVSDGNKPS